MDGAQAKAAAGRDPGRRYCPACEADITRVCSWFALPLGVQMLTVSVLPELCPECAHPLRPPPAAPSRVQRPS